VILRSNFKTGSDADIAAAVQYGKKIKCYPLGKSPADTVPIDVYDKMFDSTIPYDSRFFESLNRFVQAKPWLTRDKVMIDMLKSIGIEKGKPFNPDAKTKSIMDSVARQARAEIAFTADVQKLVAGSGKSSHVLVALSGEVSPQLRQELEARGFTVQDRSAPGP
jgi:hypothetical protein